MEEIILRERELREKIVEVVNSSKLPAIIIKPVLKEVLEQVLISEQQQYQQALKSKEVKENSNGKNKTK